VVEHEIEGMLREYAQSLVSSGVDVERADLDWQAVAEQIRPQAERRVQARLLLDAAAEKLGVEVGEDEFERTLAVIAKAQRRSTVAIRQELDRSGRLAGLRQQMAREKALTHLLGEEQTDGTAEAGSAVAGASQSDE
jgi:trigger factor